MAASQGVAAREGVAAVTSKTRTVTVETSRPQTLCPVCSPAGGEQVFIPFVSYHCAECGWLWRYGPLMFLWNLAKRRRWKSMQEKWDEQIELNLSASHFGRGREARMIGARMMHCPNNPRNGGDGFDTGDGTWRDRRWTS